MGKVCRVLPVVTGDLVASLRRVADCYMDFKQGSNASTSGMCKEYFVQFLQRVYGYFSPFIVL